MGFLFGDICIGIFGDVFIGYDCLIFDLKFGMDFKILKLRLKWGVFWYLVGKKF